MNYELKSNTNSEKQERLKEETSGSWTWILSMKPWNQCSHVSVCATFRIEIFDYFYQWREMINPFSFLVSHHSADQLELIWEKFPQIVTYRTITYILLNPQSESKPRNELLFGYFPHFLRLWVVGIASMTSVSVNIHLIKIETQERFTKTMK